MINEEESPNAGALHLPFRILHFALCTFPALTKARLTAMVTLTTATGYILAAGQISRGMVTPMLGVFLLACGAVALNQVQEAKLDARMDRTSGRPIASGRLDRTSGLFLAMILILLGAYFLARVPGKTYVLLALGGFAVLWYNGVYTLLKRVTAFAVVPGALIGAVGPMIGWLAGGGGGTGFQPVSAGSAGSEGSLILPVAAFFFVWQIPHFWLLVLIYGEQYTQAGLPSLAQVFTRPQLARITFMWVAAVAAMGVMLAGAVRCENASVFGSASVCENASVASGWPTAVLLASSIGLLFHVAHCLWRSDADERGGYRRAFVAINVFGLVVMLCLAIFSLSLEGRGLG